MRSVEKGIKLVAVAVLTRETKGHHFRVDMPLEARIEECCRDRRNNEHVDSIVKAANTDEAMIQIDSMTN